MIFLGVL